MAAVCDKAGRKANQDNIYLSCRESMQIVHDEYVEIPLVQGLSLSDAGALLAVADGMGGMNAGEVASQIVVDTLGKEMNALSLSDSLTSQNAADIARKTIMDADAAIKCYVSQHPEVSGTGSTVVLLWLLGEKAVVAWCGDSRCYRYNPRRGLEQLTKDHSYVQRLVDDGIIRPEESFGHPDSNIITRCLSDDKEMAVPDVEVVDVYNGDTFLLCSDGLCGLLSDEMIEGLFQAAEGNALDALQLFWHRGQAEGWSDNVSIITAQVHGVETEAPLRQIPLRPKVPSYSTPTDFSYVPANETHRRILPWKKILTVFVAILLLLVVLFLRPQKRSAHKMTPQHPSTQVTKTAPAHKLQNEGNLGNPSIVTTAGELQDESNLESPQVTTESASPFTPSASM